MLNWNWNDKIGDCYYENGSTATLYKGNAFVIALHEYPDNTYQMAWFACDEEHMKNMLGLSKGYDNVFESFGIKKMCLNVNHRGTAKLVSLISKSKTPITIELFKEVVPV